MEQWQTVYTTNKMYEAEMLKEMLLADGIEAVVFNQQDSSYLFGDIQIKVNNADVEKAYTLIENFTSQI